MPLNPNSKPIEDEFSWIVTHSKTRYFGHAHYKINNLVKGEDSASLLKHHNIPGIFIADGISATRGDIASSIIVNMVSDEFQRRYSSTSDIFSRVDEFLTQFISEKVSPLIKEHLTSLIAVNGVIESSTTFLCLVLEGTQYLHAYNLGDSDLLLIYPVIEYDGEIVELRIKQATFPFFKQSSDDVIRSFVDESGVVGEPEYLKLRIPRNGIIAVLGTDGAAVRENARTLIDSLARLLRAYSLDANYGSSFEGGEDRMILNWKKGIIKILDHYLLRHQKYDDATLSVISLLPLLRPRSIRWKSFEAMTIRIEMPE